MGSAAAGRRAGAVREASLPERPCRSGPTGAARPKRKQPPPRTNGTVIVREVTPAGAGPPEADRGSATAGRRGRLREVTPAGALPSERTARRDARAGAAPVSRGASCRSGSRGADSAGRYGRPRSPAGECPRQSGSRGAVGAGRRGRPAPSPFGKHPAEAVHREGAKGAGTGRRVDSRVAPVGAVRAGRGAPASRADRPVGVREVAPAGAGHSERTRPGAPAGGRAGAGREAPPAGAAPTERTGVGAERPPDGALRRVGGAGGTARGLRARQGARRGAPGGGPGPVGSDSRGSGGENTARLRWTPAGAGRSGARPGAAGGEGSRPGGGAGLRGRFGGYRGPGRPTGRRLSGRRPGGPPSAGRFGFVIRVVSGGRTRRSRSGSARCGRSRASCAGRPRARGSPFGPAGRRRRRARCR